MCRHTRHTTTARNPDGIPQGAVRTRPGGRVPAVLPEPRAGRARLLGRRPHLPGHHRRPSGRHRRRQRVRLLRRPAVRQRPAALRPPADRLRQGRRAALPDHARPASRAPVRLGLPRPARGVRGREAARHQDQGRDRGDGRRRVQRRLPRLGAAVHRGVARVRHPAGPLGRLRQRLQDARPGLHGERHVGVQVPVGQGPGLRGLPRPVVLLALRDATVQHRDPDGRRLPRPPGPGRHGRPAARDRRAGAGVDDDAVDAAVEPRDGRAPRRRLRDRRARTASATCWPRPGSRPTPASWARTRRCVARYKGSRPARPPLHAAVRLLRGRRERAPGPGRRLRHHRGRHRASCTSRPPSARRTRSSPTRPASTPVTPVDVHGRFDATGPAVRGHARLRRQRPDHPRPQGRREAAAPRDLRPPVPALLALRQPAHPARGVVVVRRGHQVPRPDGRAEPADQLGARARPGRPVRQVAGERPRLVDLAQPVLGLADPGVGVGRPRVPAHRRVRLAGRDRARLRRATHRPAPPVRRRADPAQPGRPDRAVDDAPGARGAGLLVRVRVDAVRPGALPVRERGLVRAPLPG